MIHCSPHHRARIALKVIQYIDRLGHYLFAKSLERNIAGMDSIRHRKIFSIQFRSKFLCDVVPALDAAQQKEC